MSEHQFKSRIYSIIFNFCYEFLKILGLERCTGFWGSKYGPVVRSGKHVMQIRDTLHSDS